MRNKSLSLDSDPDSLLPACRESCQPGRGRESYSRSTHSLYQSPARGPTVRVCSSQFASAPLLYNALTPSSPAPSSPNFSRPNYCASPPRPHLSHTRYGAHCTSQPQLSSPPGRGPARTCGTLPPPPPPPPPPPSGSCPPCPLPWPCSSTATCPAGGTSSPWGEWLQRWRGRLQHCSTSPGSAAWRRCSTPQTQTGGGCAAVAPDR